MSLRDDVRHSLDEGGRPLSESSGAERHRCKAKSGEDKCHTAGKVEHDS